MVDDTIDRFYIFGGNYNSAESAARRKHARTDVIVELWQGYYPEIHLADRGSLELIGILTDSKLSQPKPIGGVK